MRISQSVTSARGRASHSFSSFFPFPSLFDPPHIEPAFYCRSFPHEAILLCQVYPDCNWARNHTVSTPQLQPLPFSALRAIDMAMLPREPHHSRVTHVQFHNCPPRMLIPILDFSFRFPGQDACCIFQPGHGFLSTWNKSPQKATNKRIARERIRPSAIGVVVQGDSTQMNEPTGSGPATLPDVSRLPVHRAKWVFACERGVLQMHHAGQDLSLTSHVPAQWFARHFSAQLEPLEGHIRQAIMSLIATPQERDTGRGGLATTNVGESGSAPVQSTAIPACSGYTPPVPLEKRGRGGRQCAQYRPLATPLCAPRNSSGSVHQTLSYQRFVQDLPRYQF